MRLLVDECTGERVVRWLREQGHDVCSVAEIDAGTNDTNVLELSVRDDRILITADTDFGDKVFAEGLPHRGIVLLRLRIARPSARIDALKRLLNRYPSGLSGRYVVVTDAFIRFAPDK